MKYILSVIVIMGLFFFTRVSVTWLSGGEFELVRNDDLGFWATFAFVMTLICSGMFVFQPE